MAMAAVIDGHCSVLFLLVELLPASWGSMMVPGGMQGAQEINA